MGVIKEIAPQLHSFVYALFGEQKVHELGGEFLGTPYKPSNPLFDAIDEVVHSNDLFIAWLWFDYLHKGKPVVQHFYNQSTGLSAEAEGHLAQLVSSMVISVFRIGNVKPGNIECVDLRSGVHYHVREFALAHQIHRNDVMILRICNQAGHWDIIMPDGSITPVTIVDDKLADEFAQQYPKRITMKDTMGYKLLSDSLGISETENKMNLTKPAERVSRKEAFALLADAMLETKVYKYVDVDSITKILEKEFKSKRTPMTPPIGMRVLVGLANEDRPDDTALLMDAAQTYWNSLISPAKLKAAQNQPSNIQLSFNNLRRWLDDANLADQALRNNDPEAACEVYEALFTHLLEDKTTTASLYRLVANIANTYFALGIYATALDLLEEAEALCPTYDFAKKIRSLARSGYYKPGTEEDASQVYWTPAHEYLEWFDTLSIDLSAGDGHQTNLTKHLDNKLGRNDPCICGAVRPNGLPVKYKNCHGA